MISARTSSTTLRVLENGALKTAIPRRVAAGQVDLVGADAERPDGHQPPRLVEDRLGDLGAGSDAEDVDVGDSVGQLALLEGASGRLDLEAGIAEAVHGDRMDVLQEQGPAHHDRSYR